MAHSEMDGVDDPLMASAKRDPLRGVNLFFTIST